MSDEKIRLKQREKYRTGEEQTGFHGRSYRPPLEQDPAGIGSTPPQDQSARALGGFRWRPLAAMVAAGVLAAATYFGFSGGATVDQVSAAEAQSRIEAYQVLTAGSGLPLSYVAPEDVDQAIANMPPSVNEQQREQVRTQINQGRIRLAWLTLWDTHAQDGDVLRFESSASFPIEVTALNAKTTIAIPYPADGNVLVTGVRDGGGGITIALESGAASIAWPTMAPGDMLNLPVTPSF